MERKIVFLDKDRQKVSLEVSIEDGKFSISGECGGSMGQCYDEIKPANKYQFELLEVWDKWHLNDLQAGTPKQMKALEKCKDKGYDASLKFLEKIKDKKSEKLLIDRETPKEDLELVDTLVYDDYNGHLYKFGTSWLKKDLPKDFENYLNTLLDNIEKAEETESRKVTEKDIALFSEKNNPEACLALALNDELNIDEIDDIEESDNYRYTVQGIDYLCGTDEEMDEVWDEYLENYIDDCLEIPENMQNYFDREAWKEDAKIDGRGHSLNGYDGGEDCQEVEGVYYYIYRQ